MGLEEELDYEIEREEREELAEEIRELQGFREANLEVLGDMIVKQRELREIQLELDDLVTEYYDYLERRDISGRMMEDYNEMLDEQIEHLERVSEELLEEYDEVLDDHVDLLEDQAGEERRGMVTRLVGGLASLGSGLWLADLYLPQEGIFEFYGQLPEIASESPEVALLSVGLPAAGIYALKRSYDKFGNYTELESELSEYAARKGRLRER